MVDSLILSLFSYTVKTTHSIDPCLPHHHLSWGDPKGRILHISPSEGAICKSIWCCYCPITSLTCPCRRSLLLQRRESKPALHRNTSLPHPSQRSRWASPRVLLVPEQLLSASSSREWEPKGRTDRRGSGGTITSLITPARFARIHLPDPLVRQKKVTPTHLRSWTVASSNLKTCCSSKGASEGSHPTPDFVASSLLTLERHQRR